MVPPERPPERKYREEAQPMLRLLRTSVFDCRGAGYFTAPQAHL